MADRDPEFLREKAEGRDQFNINRHSNWLRHKAKESRGRKTTEKSPNPESPELSIYRSQQEKKRNYDILSKAMKKKRSEKTKKNLKELREAGRLKK